VNSKVVVDESAVDPLTGNAVSNGDVPVTVEAIAPVAV